MNRSRRKPQRAAHISAAQRETTWKRFDRARDSISFCNTWQTPFEGEHNERDGKRKIKQENHRLEVLFATLPTLARQSWRSLDQQQQQLQLLQLKRESDALEKEKSIRAVEDRGD